MHPRIHGWRSYHSQAFSFVQGPVLAASTPSIDNTDTAIVTNLTFIAQFFLFDFLQQFLEFSGLEAGLCGAFHRGVVAGEFGVRVDDRRRRRFEFLNRLLEFGDERRALAAAA